MVLLRQQLLVFKHEALDLPQVLSGDAAIMSERHRLKPELAFPLRRANMDVRWLTRFIRVKVKAVSPYPQNRGHGKAMPIPLYDGRSEGYRPS
jgi:hypothetical protein